MGGLGKRLVNQAKVSACFQAGHKFNAPFRTAAARYWHQYTIRLTTLLSRFINLFHNSVEQDRKKSVEHEKGRHLKNKLKLDVFEGVAENSQSLVI